MPPGCRAPASENVLASRAAFRQVGHALKEKFDSAHGGGAPPRGLLQGLVPRNAQFKPHG